MVELIGLSWNTVLLEMSQLAGILKGTLTNVERLIYQSVAVQP
jgi:hypothetical protein